MLDLMLINQEEMFVYIKAVDSLGYNDHKMVEFRIMKGREKSKGKHHNEERQESRFRLALESV